MIQYHQNFFVPTIIVFCFLPFLWSVKPDKDTSTTSVQGSTGHPNYSTLSYNVSTSSSPSPVNLINYSNQSEPNILYNLTTTLPLSPSSTTSKSSSSAIINNSSSPKSTDQFSYSTNNSTQDPSLSTTTINTNLTTTLVNLSQSPESRINSTIISSQSLSTSQQQDQHQQPSIESETLNSFSPQLLEFVALLVCISLVAIFLLVSSIYGCVKVYHSRYPARITFGRKFSTFENPIYVQKASSSGEIDGSRENQAGPVVEIY